MRPWYAYQPAAPRRANNAAATIVPLFGSNACSRSPELAVEAAPHAQRRLGRSKIAAAALANNRPQSAAYIGTIDWAARLKAQINKQNGRYEAAHLRRGGILMPVR